MSLVIFHPFFLTRRRISIGGTGVSLAHITSTQNHVDRGPAARHSTRDASHRADFRSDPARVVEMARVAHRDPRPASPVGRPRPFESTLSLSRPSALADLATRVSSVAGRADASPRPSPLASRRFSRWWHRRTRRPGRPRIDAECRKLVQQTAAENRLWGAPRMRMTALSRRPGVNGCDRCDVPDEGDASSFGCRLRPWREDSLGGILAKHRDAFRRRPAGAPAGAGRDRCRALVEHRLR